MSHPEAFHCNRDPDYVASPGLVPDELAGYIPAPTAECAEWSICYGVFSPQEICSPGFQGRIKHIASFIAQLKTAGAVSTCLLIDDAEGLADQAAMSKLRRLNVRLDYAGSTTSLNHLAQDVADFGILHEPQPGDNGQRDPGEGGWLANFIEPPQQISMAFHVRKPSQSPPKQFTHAGRHDICTAVPLAPCGVASMPLQVFTWSLLRLGDIECVADNGSPPIDSWPSDTPIMQIEPNAPPFVAHNELSAYTNCSEEWELLTGVATIRAHYKGDLSARRLLHFII